jgi:hypothetical protein
MNAACIAESHLSKCVFRTDLRQRPVGRPMPCVEASQLFFHPTAATVEECVHKLLGTDEICLGAFCNERRIMQGPKLVGFIRVVDLCER